jgi:hypothetical protein
LKIIVRNGKMNALIEIPGSWRLFVENATGDEAVEWAVRALELVACNSRIESGTYRRKMMMPQWFRTVATSILIVTGH